MSEISGSIPNYSDLPFTQTPADDITQPLPGFDTLQISGVDAVDDAILPSEGERGSVDLDILQAGIDRGALAFTGLRRVLAQRRLQRAERLGSELEVSTEVHKEAARAVLESRTPVAERRPTTKSQLKQSLRNDRRLRRNMRRAVTNFYLERTYDAPDINDPDTLVRVGSQEHMQRIDSERLTVRERSQEVRANQRYNKNMGVIKGNVRRVERSAQGYDIPGRIATSAATHYQTKATELTDHISSLSRTEEQIRQDIEDRKQRRIDEKRQRQQQRAARQPQNQNGN